MTVRYLGILSAVMASLLLSGLAIAQAPPAPTPLYAGNLGGGFALTGGNTDTKNFNLTAGIVRDPKTKHVTRGTASYLRGEQDSSLNLDRTGVNIRHEYTLSGRTFVFGQVDYLRDRFKEITFLWVPAVGIGYKLVNTDSTKFMLNGGVGGLIEKNPKKGIDNPTTERLLKQFDNIYLTIVHLPDQVIRHVTPLTDLHIRILELLGLSLDTYTRLADN